MANKLTEAVDFHGITLAHIREMRKTLDELEIQVKDGPYLTTDIMAGVSELTYRAGLLSGHIERWDLATQE